MKGRDLTTADLARNGDGLTCSSGSAPSLLAVPPSHRVLVDGLPAANVSDHVPMLNIPPFAICRSMTNPAVAAATAAADGVLAPMSCVPVLPAPWVPGRPDVVIGNSPALDTQCSLQCVWGGVIQFSRTTPR